MWAGLECPSDGRDGHVSRSSSLSCPVSLFAVCKQSRRIIACEQLGLSELFARKSPVS